jgi:endonuclease G
MSKNRILCIIAILVVAVTIAYSLLSGSPRRDEICPTHFLDGRAPGVEAARDKSASTLCFSGFSVRFSGVTKTPIWSAERLTGDRVKQAADLPRNNAFHEETKLPRGLRSGLSDYKRSGYDRGHLAPSGDMASAQSQYESFTLANMIPQHPCSNEGLWAGLESTVRKIAISQGEIFVVTGTVYSRAASGKSIGRGVAVPDEVFKAVYDPVTGQAGAYVADNSGESAWRTMSIAELKEATGVDAFPSLPEDVKGAMMRLPRPEKSKYRCRLSASRSPPQ